MKEHPGNIKSDETLFAILGVLRQQGPCTTAQIANEIGRSNSTVHDHISTARRNGFVVKSNDGFRLSLKFLDFGAYARDHFKFYHYCQEQVDELADRTGEVVWSAVEERAKGILIYGAAGDQAVKLKKNIGNTSPLHTLAAGKAILAFYPEEKRESIIEQMEFEQVTERTITEENELREELATVREERVAFNIEEQIRGYNVISSPVLDEDDIALGAISVGGPAHRLTEDRLRSQLAGLVIGSANEIELNIRIQAST